MRLIDRGTEKRALHEMLDSVRGGRSRALVLRDEPGAGKSALLRVRISSRHPGVSPSASLEQGGPRFPPPPPPPKP